MHRLAITQSFFIYRYKKVMNRMQPAFGQASSTEESETARKLDTFAWAAFFIWVGIAMLAELPWGWFLLGVGVLILAVQLVRLQINMKIEGFWVACGAVFLAGGLWKLLALPWPLAPILLILLGVALIGKAIVGVKR
jgi:hypothetical protein